MLRRDWSGAGTLLLGPDQVQTDEKARAAREIAGGAAAEGRALSGEEVSTMLGLVPEHKTRERLILKALHRHGTEADGCKKAMHALPYSMRSLWPHAYQASLWNRLATMRIEMDSQRPIDGDLVPDPQSSTGARKFSAAVEDRAAGALSLADVLVPLPGSASAAVLEGSALQAPCMQLLAEDGLELQQLDLRELGIRLKGVRRNRFSLPSAIVDFRLRACRICVRWWCCLARSRAFRTARVRRCCRLSCRRARTPWSS